MTRDDTETNGQNAVEHTESTQRGSLLDVEKVETIADCVDIAQIRAELPREWTVKPDLVQSATEPLEETLLFRRSLADPQLVLKPADPSRPRRNIEFHERSGPRATSQRTMTVDDFSEALRVAVNRTYQLDE